MLGAMRLQTTGLGITMSDLVRIEVMQSTWNDKYWALSIDDTRCGPDAGPWTTRRSFSVPAQDIQKILDDRENRQCDDASHLGSEEFSKCPACGESVQ